MWLCFIWQLVAESRGSAEGEGVSVAPEVSQLVDYVWAEANGQLEEVLAAPVETVKTEQVEKAEAALMSLKKLLTGSESEQTDDERTKLEGEFYGSLPHKPPHKVAIDSIRAIAQKQDLCQVCFGLSVHTCCTWCACSNCFLPAPVAGERHG